MIRLAHDDELFDKLAKLIQENQFREVALEINGLKVSLSKAQLSQNYLPLSANRLQEVDPIETSEDESDAEVSETQSNDNLLNSRTIESPMTGIYYASPSPGTPPFVKVGSTVSAGQVIALIEAMKVFNEIVASEDGVVLKIIPEPGQIVATGDPLILIQ